MYSTQVRVLYIRTYKFVFSINKEYYRYRFACSVLVHVHVLVQSSPSKYCKNQHIMLIMELI